MAPCISPIDWSAGTLVVLVIVTVAALRCLPSVKQANKEEDNRKPKVHHVRQTTERTTWW